ncbi:TetR/AcrR family transcriptional regulator [Jeotgalicoccus sp. ATCC 8456]|uniref:TetR/AcrR family transcriptional regulator n=1 Tax=Jeotgalicoccus sp. ATCC 8456 TaxID=946435 RepID=UPI0018E5C242|nr:TetR/AcrR family transcriptional regulator [Jeotgalicoccus sp. ATCC 8456]QQD85354.1 TetR family transcriptional regulator [Jeotgalicoccus sp. ATCC 8456]
MDSRQYLISDARKEQVIKASIEVLSELGYHKTSLSKIAKEAGISTGLISYHFDGKADLMRNTLKYLVEREQTTIKEAVEKEDSYTNRLITFIKVSLNYQHLNQKDNHALLEIVFNGRTEDNVPYYLVEIDEDDENQVNDLLKDLLSKGQENKEFTDFDPDVIGVIIRGAISGSVNLPQYERRSDHDDYSEKIVQSILKMIR